jgi:hypothetical protein
LQFPSGSFGREERKGIVIAWFFVIVLPLKVAGHLSADGRKQCAVFFIKLLRQAKK